MITKKSIRIIATGDSMTDTAGEGCPALAKELANAFPDREFEIINQGVGGTRVGYGLWRLTNDYEHNEKQCKALVSLDPDLVLVESFAYNNGSDGPRDGGIAHFRDMHFKIIDTIRTRTNAEIIAVVTVAPDPEHFVESVPNFKYTPVAIRRWMAGDRVAYLEEMIKIAHELELPLANVYQATLDAQSTGTPLGDFIRDDDCIHPNEKAHELSAQLILEAIKKHGVIS